MIDFIDKTSERKGTPINRSNMMALQGFVKTSISFNNDGSILETNENGETLKTEFNADGSIKETFIGEKTITKTTRFEGKTVLSEVIS